MCLNSTAPIISKVVTYFVPSMVVSAGSSHVLHHGLPQDVESLFLRVRF